MFFWILQQIIISLVLIILVHRIYIFFKNNLTIPKVKDLVNKPPKQYDEIYQSMMEQPKVIEEDSKPKEAMKAELKTYSKRAIPTSAEQRDIFWREFWSVHGSVLADKDIKKR